jgi:starch synthase
MVGRLIEQKGLDILIPAIPQIIKMGWQVVVLGTGMQHYCEELSSLAKQYRTNLFITLKFDEIFARQIYAGADAFLVPSKYEPCGISQMIAMRYGCVPVVRRTGGLADTVQDVLEGGGGFVFNEYSTDRFVECMQRARDAYWNNKKWSNLIKLNMTKNFSWEYPAKEYVKIYKKMMNKQTEEVVL